MNCHFFTELFPFSIDWIYWPEQNFQFRPKKVRHSEEDILADAEELKKLNHSEKTNGTTNGSVCIVSEQNSVPEKTDN